MAIIFLDRLGNKTQLDFFMGESLKEVLYRYHVPLDSVLIKKGNLNISEDYVLEDKNENISVELIEGFDIKSILKIYKRQNAFIDSEIIYNKRHLSLLPNGNIKLRNNFMNTFQFKKYIETTFIKTILSEGLLVERDSLIFALSGGIDSTAMLLLFSKIRKKFPLKICAATYEDFKGKNDPTSSFIKNLVNQLSIEHKLIPENDLQKIFNLKYPVRKIFNELMKTEDAHKVMYADHHVTRRALEFFAEKKGIKKICLGLHATDLVAGLLNTYASGYITNPIPKRNVGKFTYIFPLCFLTKKELKLYTSLFSLVHISSSKVNPWELNPLDRNFYYYLADQLQYFWPDIHIWLIEGNKRILQSLKINRHKICKNCESPILPQPQTKEEELCDVCLLFKKHNYLK